jgi:hypothetical protein
MIKRVQFFTILFLLSTSAMAGTIVEILDEDELTTVMIEGKQARINVSDQEYVIINHKTNSVSFVNPQEKQVMLLNADDVSGSGNSPVVNASVNSLGSGPEIAGYNTQKFTYTANGKPCGIIYGSKDAYQAKGIKELFNAMKIMMEQQRAIMGGFVNMVDACTLADMNVSEHVNTIGVPMRTERNGYVRSEIKSIKVDVNLPADAFVIPATYKTVSMHDQMKEVSGDVAKAQKKMQQYQPQMQEMMRQMQQSGQVSPEMMEQMRQAQEMMKQYQQH